ncbi:MAG: gamma-glutamyltransferase [Planctomycetes bacterium]|nr:gamma-glutamyltransferase [Planctomycetota bacterium]
MFEKRASRGAVAAAEPLAAAVGAKILDDGGNAIDAAVAVGFALAVTYPAAGNLGGGGFLVGSIGRGAGQPQQVALDFREKAPAAATSDMYVRAAAAGVKNASLVGHLASGVPGSVSGLLTAQKEWGSLPRKKVIEPALALARDGFEMTKRTHRMLAGAKSRMLRFEATGEVFYPGGDAVPAGENFVQTDLSTTLETIIEKGIPGFYDGEVADHLVVEMKRGGGIISAQDLLDYRSVNRKPIRFSTGKGNGISMPPPSSGGICLLQMYRMLSHFALDRSDAESPELYHLLAEVMRRSFADRNQYLGDPDFVDCQMERLEKHARLDKRASSINPRKASSSSQFLEDLTPPKESEQTTHYSVVDQQGNGVAVTTTLNGSFGSRVLVPGAGFLLNNEMDDFTAHPGKPNLFGLIQGSANAVAPGKRPLSSMSPTVWLDKSGDVRAVLGTPGGPTIITNVLQVLLGLNRLGLSPEISVTSPKIHHQCLPDSLTLERAIPEKTEKTLQTFGHRTGRRGSIGDFQLLCRTQKRGWVGVSDSRGGGGVTYTK